MSGGVRLEAGEWESPGAGGPVTTFVSLLTYLGFVLCVAVLYNFIKASQT